MKWGVRHKPKYKSEAVLDKLVNTDAKYGNKRTARQQLKINKLYKKFDKASDKDIKKAIKREDTESMAKYSAGRTYMKFLMDGNFFSQALNDAARNSKVDAGKDFTYNVTRNDKLGGVVINVNGNDNFYIYDPSNNIVGK